MEERRNSLLFCNNSYSDFLCRLFNNSNDGVLIRTKPNYTTPLMRLITCIRFMESCVPVDYNGFIVGEDFNEYPIQFYIYDPRKNPIIYYNEELIRFIEYLLMNGMKINILFNDNRQFSYPEWGCKLVSVYSNCTFHPSNNFDIFYCKEQTTFDVGFYKDIDKKSSIIITHKMKGQVVVADNFIAYNDKFMIDPTYFI